jgi:hypothetical protein
VNLHYLTPAGRLYELLHYISGATDAKSADKMLAEYFDLDLDTELADYFVAVGEMLLLPEEARVSVEDRGERDVARRRLDRALPRVENMFTLVPSLPSYQVKNLKSHFDAGTLSDLETASELLSEHMASLEEDGADEDDPEDESSIDRIRRLATELVEEATSADIPSDVATLIWSNGDSIVRAVDLFKIAGPENVIREYERLFGSVLMRPQAASALANTPRLRDKMLDLGKAVVLFGAAVAVPGQVAIEAANLYKALEPLVTAAVQG